LTNNIELNVYKTVQQAYLDPFTTKSDFSRTYADYVAIAACKGYITTHLTSNAYGNTWRVTDKGYLLISKDTMETDDND
jgi:hypothetical protein